jgi:peptidyl-prolyl cis-trans isomerase B (cyclophilin B)
VSTFHAWARLIGFGLICHVGLILWALPGMAEPFPKAVIETKFGSMELEFFPQKAPKHVENFIKLTTSGFYDGTIFHRVIPGFMIQGGDPNTKGDDKSKYGMGGPGYHIDAEFNDIPHTRGILSMARSRDPNSAGSQFFIMVKPATHLDGQYTAFGKVVKGMEVADKIVAQKRDSRDMPMERIEMTIKVKEVEK